MNKVFKVIWSEAHNAYVVVSEIAKNHGSKSSSTKKLLTMLIATGVMTCASFDVLAAEPNVAPKTQNYQYVAFKDESIIPPRDGAKKNITIDQKNKIKCTYVYDAKTGYWVREGYVLTVDENGGKYTPLSQEDIRADVAYTGSGNTDYILQSVTSTVEANGTVTNMGESLNKVTAGSFAGVSHSGGTEVAGSWDYIIKDSSWEGKVSSLNYSDGYVNLNAGENATAPKGFVNTESENLKWDDSRQAYFYKNQRVDYSNMYVINGKLGVFTDFGGNKVYTGTVYGKHNEILMTVKEANNKFYSYWAAEVTDPSATMATYRVEEYNKNLAKLVENDDALYRNDIKEVTLDTSKANSATIGLLRNGDKAVDGAITVTSGGGTGGSGAAHDTYVNISNTADTEGKTFATGSKVEVNGPTDAITGIKVNGVDYTIKQGSGVKVEQDATKKTTTITVDGQDTTITDTDTHNKLNSAKLNDKTLTITGEDNDSVSVDLSSIDTDTKYTAGNGIAISGENNAIAVKLKEGENNLAVTAAGLELNKDLTVDSVKAGATTVNNTGVTIGSSDTGIVLSNSNVSMGGQQITNVAAGTADTDAVNVAQLKKVSETAANANKGWKLKTKNGNVSNVNPGDEVEFDGDANIQVGNVGNKVSVTLKDALTGITSITGAGEGAGSISFDGGIKLNNKVTIDNNGKISGVANGEISADSTDAVNGSQLNAVKETANKGWTLKTTNGNVSDVKPGDEVKFDGDDNIKVSNTGKDVKVELNKELTGLTSVITNNAYVTSVDASNNKSVTNVEYVKNQIADAALSAGNGISITDKKINVKLKDGEENLKVGETGLYLRKDLIGMESITGAGGGIISFAKDSKNVTINNITFNNDGRIQGVADGKVAKDAVNFGQLQAVKSDMQASDKRLVASADGSYKPDAKGDISLRVEDSKHEGYDVVIKDVAKASDVGDVNNIASDIKNQDGSHTTVVDAVNNLNNKVGDLNYVEGGKGNYVTNGENTTTSIGKLDKALKNVADTAAKHTKVEGSSNITVTNTAKEGEAANYKVELNKDIDVDTVKATTVTTGQTVMNNDGLKVGENVSVTGTAVTAGQASISNEGLAVGPNTSLKADELKVDGKTYIDKVGLNANGQHITNVKAGEADTDAVNYGQLKDTNNHIDRVENQVVNNTNRISNLDNRVNKVGAGAAALAALHPLDFDPDAKWDFAAGYGNYRGANAAAVGAYYRPNEDTMFSVGGTFGNGENMVNAGVSFKLGSGSSHVSTSRVAMAKEIKELRGELEAMKSAMLDANAGKKIDTSKLQLFPDVPQNHWAYEYVTQLAGNGMIEGYPDGNFAGDRPMTRYEFAAILYRAMTKGAVLSDKILSEFSHELEYFTVDTVAKDKAGNPTIQRVRTVKANTNK